MKRAVLIALLAAAALVPLFVVALLLLSADDGEPERIRVLAPIDEAEIRVLESSPPRYVLRALTGLPDGCARADGHEVDRLGDTVRVRVFNTMPTGDVACTQVYGTYELNIPLGSDFKSGRQYTIDVNGQLLTLRAQ